MARSPRDTLNFSDTSTAWARVSSACACKPHPDGTQCEPLPLLVIVIDLIDALVHHRHVHLR